MAFIDKINPDVPEGRLLIWNGEFILKDPACFDYYKNLI